MKRYDISRLERHRSRFLLLGLACSLFLVWSAFEWTTSRAFIHPVNEEPEGMPEIDVVRTVQRPKPVSPIPQPRLTSGKITQAAEPFVSANPVLIDTSIHAVPANPQFTGTGPALPAEPPARPVVPVKEAPLIFAEVMPRFPGCEELGLSKEARQTCAEKALLSYIYEHVEYPQAALENGIFGMVVVRFVVEKDGSITEAEVLKDIGGGCGRAVLKVVVSMPAWIPGSQQGRKVRVQFKLPIRFEPSRD
ncbi:MAG: TonB family protein [Saprospirales bacterium]|nr:TonB family protein [Saprospirales bacterium]